MKKRILIFFFLGIFISACQPEKDSFTIYTIGDSTMADKKPEVYPETGWCQVIAEYFDESVTVKNHAVNGRSTKSFIGEGRWESILDSLKPGDYVFIQFGHNDQKKYDSTRYATPFGTYSGNLKKFIIESREKGAAPVLFTPIVRRKFGGNGKLVDTHGDYPKAMRQVADELEAPLIDLQRITEEWVNSLGDEPSKEMYLWTRPGGKYLEGRKDNTHLSEEGAKQVARFALQECEKQNLDISEKLKLDILTIK